MLVDVLFFVIGLIVGWFFLPSPLWASSAMSSLSQKYPWMTPYTTPGTGSVTPVPSSTVTNTNPNVTTTRTTPPL